MFVRYFAQPWSCEPVPVQRKLYIVYATFSIGPKTTSGRYPLNIKFGGPDGNDSCNCDDSLWNPGSRVGGGDRCTKKLDDL